MRVQGSLDEIETFANSIAYDAHGAWFNPHAMAQTMLAMVEHIREQKALATERLRSYDALTLKLSILIENAGDMSKKEIRERLSDIYSTKHWPGSDAR